MTEKEKTTSTTNKEDAVKPVLAKLNIEPELLGVLQNIVNKATFTGEEAENIVLLKQRIQSIENVEEVKEYWSKKTGQTI